MEDQDNAILQSALRSLPKKSAPSILHIRLQVLASRERSRFLLRRTLAIRMAEIRSRIKLKFDNLLKPLAVPATGGLVASFLCFGVLVNTLHIDEIPMGIFTSVVLDDPSPFSTSGKDVLVQLTVDEQGNVRDFSVPQGTPSADEMRDIGNLVLYSTFRPATRFGHPVTGKILVNIQHLRVRG